MHERPTIKHIFAAARLAFATLLALSAVVAGITMPAVLALSSSSGKTWLAQTIDEIDGVSLATVSGSLFNSLTLERLTLEDAEGVWFSAPSVTLHWQPGTLLQRKLTLSLVSIPEIEIRRAPQYASAPSSDPFAFKELTDLPISVDLANLLVERIIWQEGQNSKQVAGFAARGQIERRASVDIVAALTPASGDATNDKISLDVFLDTVTGSGDVDLSITADHDGLIANLAGLPGATTAAVNGKGDLKDWTGSAKVVINDVASADLIAHYKMPQGRLTGTLDLSPFVPSDMTDLLANPLAVDIGFEREDSERINLEGGLANPAASVSVGGRLNTANGIVSSEDIKIALIASGTAGPARLNGLQAHATINGDTANNEARFTVEASAIDIETMSVRSPTLAGNLKTTPAGPQLRFDGSVAQIVGISAVSPQVLEGIIFSGEAALDEEEMSATLTAQNEYLSLQITDVAQDTSGGTKARVGFKVSDLENMPGAIPGALDLTAILSVSADGALSVNAGGTLKARGAAPHWINRLTRETLNFDLDAIVKNGLVRVADLTLSSDLIALGGQGTLGDDRVSAVVKLTAQPDSFADLAGRPVQDPATADLRISGPLAQVLPTGTIRLPAFGSAGVLLSDVSLDLSPHESDRHVEMSLSAQSNSGPISVTSRLSRFSDGGLKVEDLAAKLANLTMAGGLVVPMEGGSLPEGLLTVSLSPAPAASDGFLGLSGRFDMVASLGKEAAGVFNLSGSGPTIQYGTSEELIAAFQDVSLAATADLGANDLSPTGTFSAKAIEAGGLFIDAIDAQVALVKDGPNFLVTLLQSGQHPTNLTLDGQVRTQGDLTTIMSDIRGQFGGAAVVAAQPFDIRLNQVAQTLSPTTLNIGDGNIDLAFEKNANGIDAKAKVTNFDIAAITHFLQRETLLGTLEAEAAVRSDRQNQSLSATFRLDNLRPRGEGDTPRITVEGRLETTGSALIAQTTAGQSKAAKDVVFTANVPIEWDSTTWLPTLASTKPISGRVQVDTQLEPWWALAALTDHVLRGVLTADLAVSGTIETPVVTGLIAAEDGFYDNLIYGSRVQNMAARVILEKESVRLESLSANDGRGGTMEASGGLMLSTLEPRAATLDLNDFQLIAKDDLEARASADLDLAKTGEALLLRGVVGIEEARYAISVGGAASVAELPVEEINSEYLSDPKSAAVVSNAAGDAGNASSSLPITLDIQVNAPRRIFVTGMGLTSEWRTNLDIGGAIASPDVTGQIQVVRGELEFAGKRFNIDRGQIYLDGGPSVEPRLDILAQNTQGEFTARIGITGVPSNPEIALSSNPSLPDDEILSRILFGTSATDLSALEAVQLGSAVAALSGGGSGALDVAGKARSATGLDRLSLGSGDSGTAITGGKYLSEDLYLEFTTDPRSGQYLAAIEWYVTRTLSLLSQYGAQTGSNVAARWSRTY